MCGAPKPFPVVEALFVPDGPGGCLSSLSEASTLEVLGWEKVDEMVRLYDNVPVQRALLQSQCPRAISGMFVRRADELISNNIPITYIPIGSQVCFLTLLVSSEDTLEKLNGYM